MEDPPEGNSEGGPNVPSREEFNTAIGDLSAKLESLMMTMSQIVHGTAPAATCDGGESRGGRHTAPGAEQQGLDQAPNTEGQQVFCLWRQEPFHPTMPQADLPGMWGEETPHQGMYLEGGVCWGHGKV